MKQTDVFYNKLKKKVHEYIMFVYDRTEHFPSFELYGATSQLRRASVSIMLNFIEGHARFKPKVKLNFFEICYGSVKECKYLLFLACERCWISKEEYAIVFQMIDEIARMIWSLVNGLQIQIDSG